MTTQYIVYILKCADRTLYTGITNDLPRRFALHQQGKASSYTRSHKPIAIVHQEICADKSSALKRELAIKSLTRAQKLILIQCQTSPSSSTPTTKSTKRG